MELPGRSPLPAAGAPSPSGTAPARSVARSDSGPVPGAAASVARSLWPSSSSDTKNSRGKKAPRAPSPLSSSAASTTSSVAATLASLLAKDEAAAPNQETLSRQRSCTELPRFADADAEARKICRSSYVGGDGHAFGRSKRLLQSTKPAGVTHTPGRVAPSDLRQLSAPDADAAVDVASSGSECSDASRGSTPRGTVSSKPPLLPRTSSVCLLGSSATQWALSSGRRSGLPLRA